MIKVEHISATGLAWLGEKWRYVSQTHPNTCLDEFKNTCGYVCSCRREFCEALAADVQVLGTCRKECNYNKKRYIYMLWFHVEWKSATLSLRTQFLGTLPPAEEFMYLGVLFTSEGRKANNQWIWPLSAVMRMLLWSVVVVNLMKDKQK